MAPVESKLIAERLRSLIGRDYSRLDAFATDLGVSVVDLKASIDEQSPQPTLQVIIAMVRWYGVDPTWIVTGEYDAARHRTAIGDDEAPATSVIADLVARAAAPADPLDLRPPPIAS